MGDDGNQKRRVDLVRVPREDVYYDKEEVLGRELKSVFPNESKMALLESAARMGMVHDSKKFISESELLEMQSEKTQKVMETSNKPLAEILREQKEAKQAKFEDQWKQMKTGKNRPLDEDELEFLDTVIEAENVQRRKVMEEEKKELEAFREAIQSSQVDGGRSHASSKDQESNEMWNGSKGGLKNVETHTNTLKKIITARAKRPRAENPEEESKGDPPDNILQSLLGAYGSEDEDE